MFNHLLAVFQLFDWMQKREMTNVASYSSFMKYMGESRNLIRALQVYSSIEDESTRNNVSICNSLLGCMLKDRKFESCIKMFNQMKENGLVPDLFTYSTVTLLISIRFHLVISIDLSFTFCTYVL